MSLFAIVMAVGMSVSFVSCGDDDDDNNGYVITPSNNSGGNEDDEAMYDIVGTWKGVQDGPTWAYKCNFTLNVKVDKTFTSMWKSEAPGQSAHNVYGTWEYNKSDRSWYFKETGSWSGNISGTYKLIRGQLIHYDESDPQLNIIYDKQ